MEQENIRRDARIETLGQMFILTSTATVSYSVET